MSEVETRRILVVDDEAPIRRALARVLDGAGYECDTASNVADARRLLDTAPFAVVLCDVMMPDESGFSLLAYAHNVYPEVAVIMVTAVDDPRAAEPVARNGAYGYIIKPFDSSAILINVAGALERRAGTILERRRRQALERTVATRTEELSEALQLLSAGDKALMASQEETVVRLALAAEWRDPSTGRHLEQMSVHTARLATLAGFDSAAGEQLRIASKMHDIGKVALPDDVLLKPGRLTDSERVVMQVHAEIGARMLDGSQSPLLQLAAIVALTHHERWDGSGYPRGLTGAEIPLPGRIVAVADVYDALRSERPYKPAFSVEESMAILRQGRGAHLDPDLVDLFVAYLESDPGSAT